MRLSFGQIQAQVQKQILAPRMIQSMEILQLNQQALEERLEQELAENPVLELADDGQATPPAEDEAVPPPAEAAAVEPTPVKDVDEKPLVVDEEHGNKDDFERLLNLDSEVPDYFDEMPRKSAGRIEEDNERIHDALANVPDPHPQTLQDYLLHQLGEMEIEPELMAMCEKIISTLDPRDGGYFRSSLRDLLPADAGPEQLALAERALAVVQSLDPPGIAARDLKECLLKQLTPDLLFYEELQTLIANHLEDLRDNKLPLIQKKTGFSIELIQEAWKELRTLNPKPGASFAAAVNQAVTPDVFVDREEDGSYKVRVDDSRVPTLQISRYYLERLRSGTATPEEREFIKRKITAAQWLIDAIEQRRSTLTKVAQAIVDHQRQFLDDGPEFIRPLKMQEVADKVGVHVTTVSRAVDEKYMQTPRGIFALKRFFVGGTQAEGGEDVAWDIIRLRLQEVIDKEDKLNPLSDDDLVKELKKLGLTVARRTITKYRQKMGIPSSRQRKDWAKAAAEPH
jgi:RNA polymerase sigma-54 factor